MGRMSESSQHEAGWVLVDEVINAFKARHPRAWIAFINSMEQERRELLDPRFATGKDKRLGTRRTASFPYDPNGFSILDGVLKVRPDILKDDKVWREFLYRHPEFRLPEKL